MIVRQRPDGSLWLFDQIEHARLCGEMAEAWAVAGTDVPDPVVMAARHHDDGWAQWDRRPRLDAGTGLPHSYRAMPADDYLEIWERSVDAAWDRGADTGMLVSLHGCRFFERKERPEDRAFLRRERARQRATVRGRDGLDHRALPAQVATHDAWMYFWDGLSLFLCDGWDSPWRHTVPAEGGDVELAVRIRRGDEPDAEVAINPYPFDCRLDLSVSARVVPAGPYESQAALDSAVEHAGVEPVRWQLRA